jgi:hypothetical protein
LPRPSARAIMAQRLIAASDPGKENGMTSAGHGSRLFCLVVAACLVTCIGCSAPLCCPAGTSEAAAGTPALIFFTPESETAGSAETPEAPAVPSPNSGTPAMVFFTPTAGRTDQVGSPGPAATPGGATGSGTGTPGAPPASGVGTPTARYTRVALELTPSATIMPRSSRPVVTPSGTAGPKGAPVPGEGPIARWPKGWGVAVGAVLLMIVIAWLLARRRSQAGPVDSQ